MAESQTGSAIGGSSSSSMNSIIFLQNLSTPTKLKDTNFLIWRKQILATVRGYGLEGYLTGFTQPLPMWIEEKEGATTRKSINPEYTTWERQDHILSAWIQSSLTEAVMIMVVGLTTSASIWHALETNFSSQSRAKVMQYKLQLQTLKKDSMSMTEYLSKVKTCCDLLNFVGHHVSDEDQIMHILNGLGSEYDAVMVTVSSKMESWTTMDIHCLLLSFENRLESTKSAPLNSDGSQPYLNYMAQTNTQRGAAQNYRGK